MSFQKFLRTACVVLVMLSLASVAMAATNITATGDNITIGPPPAPRLVTVTDDTGTTYTLTVGNGSLLRKLKAAVAGGATCKVTIGFNPSDEITSVSNCRRCAHEVEGVVRPEWLK